MHCAPYLHLYLNEDRNTVYSDKGGKGWDGLLKLQDPCNLHSRPLRTVSRKEYSVPNRNVLNVPGSAASVLLRIIKVCDAHTFKNGCSHFNYLTISSVKIYGVVRYLMNIDINKRWIQCRFSKMELSVKGVSAKTSLAQNILFFLDPRIVMVKIIWF